MNDFDAPLDHPTDLPDPTGLPDIDAPAPLSVAEVLAMAELPERTAEICVRPDLQAKYDAVMSELATLVTATGEVIEDAEASIGEKTAEARAIELNAEAAELRRQMRGAMWRVTFRGMSTDDWDMFVKRFRPKDRNANMDDFYNRLIAETSVDDDIDIEAVKALRKKFGQAAMTKLTNTAVQVCTRDGIDVPKLPAFSRNLAERYSDD